MNCEYECPKGHGNLRKNGVCPICGAKARPYYNLE